jgi:hypothetical protein
VQVSSALLDGRKALGVGGSARAKALRTLGLKHLSPWNRVR